MKRVLVFGTFDPFHPGHLFFLSQAKTYGDHLTVVVARDSAIQTGKRRAPWQSEEVRLDNVQRVPGVDQALLGDEQPEAYRLLKELSFDILALGYDQSLSDQAVRQLLLSLGKSSVTVIRIAAHKPGQYKSSLLRTS